MLAAGRTKDKMGYNIDVCVMSKIIVTFNHKMLNSLGAHYVLPTGVLSINKGCSYCLGCSHPILVHSYFPFKIFLMSESFSRSLDLGQTCQ